MKKTYRVTLTALGPIFIGSGEKLKKYEYIFDKPKKVAHMIDHTKFTKYLLEKNLLDDFTSRVNSHFDLYDYLVNKKGIVFMPLVKYSVPVAQFRTEVKNRFGKPISSPPMNDLNTFVKDAFGRPYIPGSSLKGALRTAILNDLKEDTKENEVFAHLQVSDSETIDLENLKVYQKVDYSKTAKPLPLYRECLKPNTEITFTVSFDDEYLTLKKIQNALHKTYQHYYIKWLKGGKVGETLLKGVYDSHADELKKNTFALDQPSQNQGEIIYIGGGAGLVSKTLHYKSKNRDQARNDSFDILKQQFRATYGKMRSVPDNVPVALKLAVETKTFNGRVTGKHYLEMGKARIKFEELK